ncbi:hypothetical protein [Paenibacillus xylanexedens]|uniref:hypothetical protein n=1 Tax=Paenibacillus xylanexedens TaxID=528191 RepID=UPI0011A6DC5E|nr:hypothetical protein [Paenibacillus xylanexedens]
MYIDHVEMNPIIAAAKEREERSRSRFIKPNRINGIIQHEVAQQGFNLYPGHVEWFSPYSETWISFEIPNFVFYMDTAEQIVNYLVSYLNLAEECEANFSK